MLQIKQRKDRQENKTQTSWELFKEIYEVKRQNMEGKQKLWKELTEINVGQGIQKKIMSM